MSLGSLYLNRDTESFKTSRQWAVFLCLFFQDDGGFAFLVAPLDELALDDGGDGLVGDIVHELTVEEALEREPEDETPLLASLLDEEGDTGDDDVDDGEEDVEDEQMLERARVVDRMLDALDSRPDE